MGRGGGAPGTPSPELAPESSQGTVHHRWAGKRGIWAFPGCRELLRPTRGEGPGGRDLQGCRKLGWRAERHGKAISGAQSREASRSSQTCQLSVEVQADLRHLSDAQTDPRLRSGEVLTPLPRI